MSKRDQKFEFAGKDIQLTAWEVEAIIQIAKGWQINKIAANSGLRTGTAMIRVGRMLSRVNKQCGCGFAGTALACRLAYSLGLVRL